MIVNAECEINDKDSDRHFRSQYTFITDVSDDLVADYVGRFERLTEDFEEIAGKLGVHGVELPHMMKIAVVSIRLL